MSDTTDTNTPSGASKNGYLKNLREHDSVPQLCTTDLGIGKNFEMLQESDNLFSESDGVAVVSGDEIALGEVTLLVGDIGKDHPGKTYSQVKSDAMEASKKAEEKHKDKEEAINEDKDKNNNGIDDRFE